MKSLLAYIKENIEDLIELIEEGAPHFYQRNHKGKFNYTLVSHGHAAERDMERLITDEEVRDLMKDVWSKYKAGIEKGQILINQKDSKKSGSSVAIHSSEKAKAGYLTIVVFPYKYHKNADYYELEVVTTWKGREVESFKKKDENGKTMYHPEKGQLDIWDSIGVNYRNKEDVMKI